MPYKIVRDKGQYVVVKKDDNTRIGAHATRKKARAQIIAIEISEGKKPWTHWGS